MKTAIVRKPISNAIVDPYNFDNRSLLDLKPEGVILGCKITAGMHIYASSSTDILIYKIPAICATLDLPFALNIRSMAYFSKEVVKLWKMDGIEDELPTYSISNVNNPKEANFHHYCHNFGKYDTAPSKNVIVPREIFCDINEFVYLLISLADRKKNNLLLHYSTFPIGNPFFWDMPVATSLLKGQPLNKSCILLGAVKKIEKDITGNGKYSLISLNPSYYWDGDADEVLWSNQERENENIVDNSICRIVTKSAVCSLHDIGDVYLFELPIYIYNKNRVNNGIGVSAFVWHSGNEDDLVKKSLAGYSEDDADFYNEHSFLLDSLSLTTVFGSYVSLTKISLDEAARYIIRYVARQPQGCRSVSVEGKLLNVLGGALRRIFDLIDGQGEIENSLDDKYNKINTLFKINGSHLYFDSNIEYSSLSDNNPEKIFIKDILGIDNGSNGCIRVKEILKTLFENINQISSGKLRLDYIYCDIEALFNDARSLAVQRFPPFYQMKYENCKEEKDIGHQVYGKVYEDLLVETKNELLQLGYVFPKNGIMLIDIAGAQVGENKDKLFYGTSNNKSYAQRRNLNVWDVVMKNYTNKLFYDYVVTPIKKIFPGARVSINSRFKALGYLDRSEMYETYLGGNLKLEGDLYSSIPLYEEHISSGSKKLCMDNWHIFPIVTPFSFLMDHINRLRLVALSSKGKFDVFITTWNIWAYSINQKLHFYKNGIKSNKIHLQENKKLLTSVKAYYYELLYHTFLMNPDKVISYFNLEQTRRNDVDYIPIEEKKYYRDSYDDLQSVLVELNDLFAGKTIKPLVKTMAAETEPYILSGGQTKNNNIWRLTVNNDYVCDTEVTKRKLVSFTIGDRCISFKGTFGKNVIVKTNKDKSSYGIWVITPRNVKPNISTLTGIDYYYKNPAYYIDGINDSIVDSKIFEINKHADYSGLQFKRYNAYTLFGEVPQRHFISMKFKLKNGINIQNKIELLQLSFLGNFKAILVPSSSVSQSSHCSFQIVLKDKVLGEELQIDNNEWYELRLSINVLSPLFSEKMTANVEYSLIKDENHLISKQHRIEFEYSYQYFVSSMYLFKYQNVTFDSIAEFPVEFKGFRLYFSEHQEKVELFRKSNGLNISRVNKGVAAYADSQVEDEFYDYITAKVSWLNASNNSIRYCFLYPSQNLSGTSISLKNNKSLKTTSLTRYHADIVYPIDGRVTIIEAKNNYVIFEVAAACEGYILVHLPKSNYIASKSKCSLKVIP